MEFHLVIVLALAIVVGVSLGLLGGGGSILTVPLLTYVAGLDPKEAIAASLFVVGTTSIVSTVMHARQGNVRWRTGLIFGVAGMTGAFLGGLAGGHIPGTVLMIAFAIMMVATAVAMIRGRKARPSHQLDGNRELPVRRVLLDGLVVGLVTGLVGAGGGFLVVPALALLGGLPMPVAVGTSLVVIAMKSFAGLAGYLSSVHINWGLAAAVTAAAIVGSFAGGRLAGRIPADLLRKAFGWFVVVMGVFVLGQQLPEQLRTNPLLWTGVGAAAAVAVAVTVLHGRRNPEPRSEAVSPAPVAGHGEDVADALLLQPRPEL
jgi:uncharacterized membrane protein YfcA